MNRKQALIEDHKELLEIRLKSIKRDWSNRNKPRFDRDLLKWLIGEAKTHKHMIVQLSELPNAPFDFCGSW
jgi:hypothetical protein